MKCDQILDVLTDVATGRAGEDDLINLERHLAECPTCREEAQAMRLTMNYLNRVQVPDPGEAFWRRFPVSVRQSLDESLGMTRTIPARSPLWSRISQAKVKLTVPVLPAVAMLLVVLISGATIFGLHLRQASVTPAERIATAESPFGSNGFDREGGQFARVPRVSTSDEGSKIGAPLLPPEVAKTNKKLVSAQREWLDAMGHLHTQRRELMVKLRRYVDKAGDDAAIKDVLKDLRHNTQSIRQEQDRYGMLLDGLLSPREQAAYLLSVEDQRRRESQGIYRKP